MSTTYAGTLHPEYELNIDNWQRVRNAVSGLVVEYLRNVGKTESDPAAQTERQKSYVDGAVYYNFTERTLAGMQGSVYRTEPDIYLPPQLEYLLTNCDGNDQGIVQQSQESVSEDIQLGRLGLFVDMPTNGDDTNLKQQEDGALNPSILIYTAENIINWRTRKIGASNVLSMVVLREFYEYEDSENQYLSVVGTQYRTLSINKDGYYEQKVERLGDDSEIKESYIVEPRANGSRMDYIPFAFVGSENNDYTVDRAPLLALSNLNIAHYRNTADNEEQLFTTAQAMLVLAPGENMDPETWQKLNPNGVLFGARRGLNVGAGGSAMLLQSNGDNSLSKAIQEKEEQAVKIGAQLITPQQQQTATAARIQQGADTSVLASITNNVAEGYNKAIQWCANYLAVTDEFTFKLNTEFFLNEMTAQDRQAWMADIQQGNVPRESYWAALRKAGLTDKDDDTLTKELEQQPPALNFTE